jgi:DNA-binding GntR family transcriptional regulator
MIPRNADTPEAFRNTSRAEFVYRSLCEAFERGQFKQGERIREEEVAQSLGVSRTPVREALGRLLARGLLEMAPGRGLVVVELSKQRVTELYAMREVLEGTAARFAAQHASSAEIQALRKLLEELRRVLSDQQESARLNRIFHQAIYEAAHNTYLLHALNELRDAMALLPGTTYSAEGRVQSSVEEHELILSAIERRNAAAAEEAARQHIREAQRLRLELVFAVRARIAPSASSD